MLVSPRMISATVLTILLRNELLRLLEEDSPSIE